MASVELLYQRVGGPQESLSQQVAERIISLIATKHLRPGDTLPPLQDLSEKFGVSRTVIRDGLQVLSGLGIVRLKQGVQAQVVKADPAAMSAVLRVSAGIGAKGMENLLCVREILEPEVAALAAQNALPNDITDIEQAYARMDRTLDDPEGYIEADQAFHLALAQATGNDLLPRITYPVISLLQEMRRVAGRSEGAIQRGQTAHAAILQAVREKDSNGAREAMRAHLAQVRKEIRAVRLSPCGGDDGGPEGEKSTSGS